MVSAQEFGRSLRGMAALVGRRADALNAFDLTPDGFGRSFAAVALTLPAYIVSLALERRRLGLDITGMGLFDDATLAALVGAAHLASFLALPVAMFAITGRLGLRDRYVPFVIVTNWTWIFGTLALSFPSAMYLCGLETISLTSLFTIAFAVVFLNTQVFASRVTLAAGASLAVTVTALGLLLDLGITLALRVLLG